jgi:hypothetical protein
VVPRALPLFYILSVWCTSSPEWSSKVTLWREISLRMGTDFLSRGNRRWSVWEGEQCCAVRARFAGCARGIGRDCRSETRALPFNFLIHDSHNTFAILRILPESRSNFAIPPRLILVQPLCLPPPPIGLLGRRVPRPVTRLCLGQHVVHPGP